MIGGRKTEIVVVPQWFDGNRDAGKHFLITEPSAAWAEFWALRLALCVKGTTAEIPAEFESMGMVGIARRGLNAVLAADVDPFVLRTILDELLTCVQIVRDPRARDQATGGPVATAIVSEEDIAEIRTRLFLRSAVLALSSGFTPADALSRLWSALTTSPESSPPT